MNFKSFFAELKRRYVYKVAVAYTVVAWLLLRAASIFLPAFNAPPWVMKIFIIVIMFGSSVALTFSWAFEITSEGIKVEAEIEPNKSVARRTGRKIVVMTIALAVVAAGLFVYQVVRSKSDIPSSSPATAAIASKSIAALPFDNLSRDPDNAYFSEGSQDEVIPRLAKIGNFKVISRTSTEQLRRQSRTASAKRPIYCRRHAQGFHRQVFEHRSISDCCALRNSKGARRNV